MVQSVPRPGPVSQEIVPPRSIDPAAHRAGHADPALGLRRRSLPSGMPGPVVAHADLHAVARSHRAAPTPVRRGRRAPRRSPARAPATATSSSATCGRQAPRAGRRRHGDVTRDDPACAAPRARSRWPLASMGAGAGRSAACAARTPAPRPARPARAAAPPSSAPRRCTYAEHLQHAVVHPRGPAVPARRPPPAARRAGAAGAAGRPAQHRGREADRHPGQDEQLDVAELVSRWAWTPAAPPTTSGGTEAAADPVGQRARQHAPDVQIEPMTGASPASCAGVCTIGVVAMTRSVTATSTIATQPAPVRGSPGSRRRA